MAGLLAIAAIVIFTYLGFTKFANPFASQYTVQAVFQNANGVKPGSPVRIAGVNVGKVQSVGPVPGCRLRGSLQPTATGTSQGCTAAEVSMTIDNNGLPIHKDATFAIRPRIFLEGNFFVDVSPGTPEAPAAPSGYTFPVQQGTEPVQFDQVLTTLQSNTRENLQTLLQQFGTAVKKGGKSYNASIKYWLPAYEYSAVVAHDALGLQTHDLSNWIAEQGEVSGAIDTHPQNLQNLITNFNTTAHSFAVQNVALSQAVAELPKTLAAAIPAFHSLNAAFCAGPQVPNCAPGPLPQLAKALIPGVKSTGPMIDASLPFITQLRYLVSPSELRGLTADLAQTVWDEIEYGDQQGTIAFFTAQDERWTVATVADKGRARMAEVAGEHSEDWRGLGVALLHRLVIDTLLAAGELPKPRYVHLVEEVVESLESDEFSLAALVMPATVDHIRSISEHRERMPAKSTYFYPKLLSGLVINPLE